MKNTLLTLSQVLIALVLVGFCAQAQADQRPRVSPGEYLEMLDNLRNDLQGGTPREMNNKEWRKFDDIEQRFQSILSNVDSVDDLNSRDRVTVFNLQEELDTLLIGRAEDQVVCDRRRRIGSRIPRQECRTLGQIRAEQDMARRFVSDIPLIQNRPGN